MRGRAWLFLMAMLGAWGYLWFTRPKEAPNIEVVIASILYLLCCIPFLIYIFSSEQTIPYLPIFSLFYFSYYGMLVFTNYKVFLPFPEEVTVKVLYLGLYGYISLLLGFYGPFGLIAKNLMPPLSIPWDPKKAERLGVSIGLLGIIVFYLQIDRGFVFISGGLTYFLTDLSRLGIAILFLLQLQGKLNFKLRVFLWLVLFTPRILIALSTGATMYIVSDLLILFFLYIFQRRKVPWVQMAIAGVVFLAIFGARDDFRTLTWANPDYAMGKSNPAKKAILYLTLIKDRAFRPQEEKQVSDDYLKLSSRADSLVTFIRVAQLTPDIIPYWGGYTYGTLLPSLIPRFLYPNKPQKMLGQEFGHRYGFLTLEDTSTSYNLAAIVEMYVNFGDAGVIVGMFLLGCIMRALYALLNHSRSGEGGIVICAVIFYSLANLDGDFSLFFGNTIQYIILFYLIIKNNIMRKPINLEAESGVR